MKDLEQIILSYLQERNWDTLKPADIAKSIMIEGAELLEIFQWSDEDLEEVKRNPQKMEKVKEELADVLIYALEMSVLLGIDTQQIILDKHHKTELKYPAELVKRTKKDGTDSDTEYYKIKEQHRKNRAV